MIIRHVFSIGMPGGEFSRGDGVWHPMEEIQITAFCGVVLPPPCQSVVYVVESLEYHDMMPRNDLLVAGMAVIDPETGRTLILTRQS